MNKVQTPPPFGGNGNRARTPEEPLTTDEGIKEEPERAWVADESGAPLVVGIPGTPGSSIGGFELGNRGGPVSPQGEPRLEPGENPFKKQEPEKVEVKEELFDAPEGTPSWGEFVKFIMAHGEDIVRARYPHPPKGEFFKTVDGPWATVDTTWKGVPVFNAERCEIQHRKYGWAPWEDCQEK